MKIKVFTTDKNGKIAISKDELQEIINEAYWEGYANGTKSEKTWTVTTPWTTTPYYNWSTTTNGSSSITIGTNEVANNTNTNSKTVLLNAEDHNIKL